MYLLFTKPPKTLPSRENLLPASAPVQIRKEKIRDAGPSTIDLDFKGRRQRLEGRREKHRTRIELIRCPPDLIPFRSIEGGRSPVNHFIRYIGRSMTEMFLRSHRLGQVITHSTVILRIYIYVIFSPYGRLLYWEEYPKSISAHARSFLLT